MRNIPTAIQMYTLRNECEADFRGTLRKVASLGFQGVELAGYGGMPVGELKDLLNELGLQVAGCHVPLVDLESNLAKVIQEQLVLESKFLVCPYLLPENRTEADYQSLISFLNKAGAECQKAGISLCYHNHDFELNNLQDGRTALDTIMEETDASLVFAEPDVYWLSKREYDPAKWIDTYRDRIKLVHLKDMTEDEERFFAEVGTGAIDFPAILKKGDVADIQWWIIEQDATRRTPFESIEISLNNLRKMLDELNK
ncbi:sugar phosphate isomerase/epimerase family protein [Niallia sp. HCP3S3_B10]|uniref:sugar phosphate isomerase/epimerase family protein n=1 Tax=Niallia sp. HCP3S3_B10 TaxID=3438944 RepID=UPI003F8AB204